MEAIANENPFKAPEVELWHPGLAEEVLTRVDASRSARLLASMIDGLIIMAIYVVVSLVVYQTRGIGPIQLVYGLIEEMGVVFVQIVNAVVMFLVWLMLNGYLLATQGQTIGKRMLDIQIISMDGSDTNLGQLAFLRYLLGMKALGFIPFYALVDALVIFGPDQRCLHDRVAGTRVVQTSAVGLTFDDDDDERFDRLPGGEGTSITAESEKEIFDRLPGGDADR